MSLLLTLRSPTVTSLVSTLTDNFDDNSLNSVKWTTGVINGNTAGTTISEVNGRTEITPNSAAPSYQGRTSVDTFNFDIAFVRISNFASSDGSQSAFIQFGPNSTTYVMAAIAPGAGQPFSINQYVNGVNVDGWSVGSLGGADAVGWFGLRINGSNWELVTAPTTASDPPISSDWSAVNGRTIQTPTRGKVCFGTGSWAGPGAATKTYYFDGFNTATTGVSGTYLYKGAKTRVLVYFGTRTDPQMYKGTNTAIFAS